jgi:hypothetical protein
LSVVSAFAGVFDRLAHSGLGPGRGRAVLESRADLSEDGQERSSPERSPAIEVSLLPGSGDMAVRSVRILFQTPTELKPDGDIRNFGTLFARARDRIGTLSTLYGDGPLSVDYQSLGQRASAVRLVNDHLMYHEADRRSSRTGAVHGVGGFTGEATYEGDVAEFLPWLRAAYWTGVGRHTVWGNGVILTQPLSSDA